MPSRFNFFTTHSLLVVSNDQMTNFMRRSSAIFIFCLISFGCVPDEQEHFHITSLSFDFNEGLNDWEADFTDYPVSSDYDQESDYQWLSEYTQVPAYLGSGSAIKLSCNNVNGDVFMFLKKKITGLRPSTSYNVVFEIELASNAITGRGVILKAGARNVEPKKVVENDNYILNLDKGDHYSSGTDLIAIGDIGSTIPVADYNPSVTGNSSSGEPFICQTNKDGEIWLIVGTESGYEGITTVYYEKINVVFSTSQ
ncbi:MAG TPA: hypothetical protein VD884_02925 [Ohtaekwangia sp.]|nr:hypothetical protein [Ohtaekwangia sp.]